VVAAIGVVLAGCAGPGGPSGRDSGWGSLERLARQETGNGAATEMTVELAPPPGLDPELAERARGDRASKSIAEIALSLDLDEPAPIREPEAVPPERRSRALKLYAGGRLALLEGDAQRAAELLSDASELDPSSADVWRALGEAQMAAGGGSMASLALERAVALGGGDAVAWEMLGSESLRAGDWDLAIARLLRARDTLSEDDEPLLGNLIDMQLSEALRRRGYERAAMESLQSAIDLPQLTQRSTRYAGEISALYRRRGDYWIEIGDLACRQGEYVRAAEAYTRGASMPRLSLQPVLPRVVHAWVRAGAPNRAALAVIKSIEPESIGSGAELIGLIKYTTEHGASRRAVGDAIALLAQRADVSTPSHRSMLARLRASALPRGEAIGALTDGLDAAPDDARLAYEVYLRAEGSEDAARLARGLVARHPWTADLHASALLETGLRASDLVSVLGNSRVERLLSARLLLASGDKEGALGEARSISVKGRAPGELLHVGEVAAACGQWDMVDAALEALDRVDEATRLVHFARARVLFAAQRFGESAEAIGPAIAPPLDATDLASLLFAADVLSLSNLEDESEALLLEARRLDPGDERPHGRLVDLYLATQSTKLGDAARRIRADLPESVLLRRLRARELVQFGQREAALQELESLIEVRPPDPQSFALIGLILGGQGEAVEREQAKRLALRLTAICMELPDVPFIRATAVRALSAAGQYEEAVRLGESSLDAAVGRAREMAVRTGLGDPERATAMARDRLGSAPRSIAESLELATVVAQDGEAQRAAELIISEIPTRAELAGQQLDAIRTVIALCAGSAFDGRDADDIEAALDLIAWAGKGRVPMNVSAHQVRLRLISLSAGESRVTRMLEAVAEAVDQHPDRRLDMINDATALLRQAGASGSLEFAKGLAQITDPAPTSDGSDAFLDALLRWTVEVWNSGNVDDLRELVDGVAEHFRLADVIDTLLPREAQTEASRAELAYIVAGAAASLGRMDEAVEMYRFVLDLEPEHALALNDLGYFLVTEYDELDEAESMLERAYELRGDDASVVDSLGWLRYKRDELLDFEEEGQKKLGAVSLLSRAKALQPDPGRRPNPNILEHLGDALWATGAGAAAAEEWAAALRAARIRRRDQSDAPEAITSELRDQIVRLSRKIAAANRGEPPDIAPREATELGGTELPGDDSAAPSNSEGGRE